MAYTLDVPRRLSLDESLYVLSADELAFFKEETGMHDEKELKEHILSVQKKAYKVVEYRCILRFGFARLKISRLPPYQEALTLLKTRQNALFLDIGCCLGNDIRKIVADGWPVENAIASDLRREFWNCGHDLFRSTPETFPASFVEGDVFSPAIISPREPFYAPEIPEPFNQSMSSLTSLTPLQGRLSVIHASSFFHLFDEEGQSKLARQLASLISPDPGSMIFGSHGGRVEKGLRIDTSDGARKYMFCHSPATWKGLWDGEVFRKGTVKVEAGLQLITPDSQLGTMWWSVTRV